MEKILIEDVDALVIEEKVKEQKELKLIGKYMPRIDGGKIFEYNFGSNIIQEVKLEESSVYDPTVKSGKKKLNTQSKCAYVEALNMKSAIKRLMTGKIIYISQ